MFNKHILLQQRRQARIAAIVTRWAGYGLTLDAATAEAVLASKNVGVEAVHRALLRACPDDDFEGAEQ